MTRIKLLPLALLAFLFFTLASPLALTHMQLSTDVATVATPSRQLSPMNYDFRVLNNTVHVYPQMDASVLINYSITFENYGTDFEYIDIGLPNPYYVLASFEAYWSLEGAPYVQLTDIAASSEIAIGIEIFIPAALRPGNGEEGTLLVWGNQPQMVYLDTDPATPGYVGYEFIATWYSPPYSRGTDYLACHLHFPDGFNNGTLAKYHTTAPTTYYWTNTSLVYAWEYTSPASPQTLIHGISFPYDESYITTYYTTNGPTNGFNLWAFLEAYGELLIYAVIFIVIFGACCISIIKNAAFARAGRRLVKRGYLPPAVKVEALGIRRGLTVVESAILNEVPLERVFTMIVFGLLKKNLITVQREGKAKPTFHPDRANIAKAASAKGRFHYYERLFLKAITPAGNLHKTQVRTMLNTLIKTTARKLEGYSRTDTKVFYTRMIDQAWKQIDLATTPKAQASAITEYAEWLLLTPDYERRIDSYHHYHVPGWYWFWIYASHPRPHTITPTATLPTGTIRPTTPITLTNFANATVLGTQNFANNVVTGFQNLANQIATAFRPPPPPPARSSFSGRSCACACACVSCACACAGGGR